MHRPQKMPCTEGAAALATEDAVLHFVIVLAIAGVGVAVYLADARCDVYDGIVRYPYPFPNEVTHGQISNKHTSACSRLTMHHEVRDMQLSLCIAPCWVCDADHLCTWSSMDLDDLQHGDLRSLLAEAGQRVQASLTKSAAGLYSCHMA